MRVYFRRMQIADKCRQAGMTLFEQIAVLGAGSVVMVAVIASINSMETNVLEKNAASYQAELARAATDIIGNKIGFSEKHKTYALDYMQGRFGLGVNLPSQNVYQQTPCLILHKDSPKKADASDLRVIGLLVTEGGEEISEDSLNRIVAQSGQASGYISVTDSGKKIIKFGFSDRTIELDDFKDQAKDDDIPSCSGTPAGKGHLATPIYWDGKKMAANYLYRMKVSDKDPFSNQNVMQTDLKMGDESDKYKITHIDSAETKYLSITKKANAGDSCVGKVDSTDSTKNYLYEAVRNYFGVDSLQPMNLENSLSIEEESGLHRILICKDGIWTLARSFPVTSLTAYKCSEGKDECWNLCKDEEELAYAHTWCHGADSNTFHSYYGVNNNLFDFDKKGPAFDGVATTHATNSTLTKNISADRNVQDIIEGFYSSCSLKGDEAEVVIWCRKKIK